MSWEGTLFNSKKRVAREHIRSQTKAVLCACVFWYVCILVHVCVCVCTCFFVYVFVCGMCVLMCEVILLVSLA